MCFAKDNSTTITKDSIIVEFEVSERGHDECGIFIIGHARLWADNLQIYQAPRIGMRIVSDWLPDIPAHVDGMAEPRADLARQIAVKDYVGAQLRVHPSAVAMSPDGRRCLNLPFNRFELDIAENGEQISISSEPPYGFAWKSIYHDWSARLGGNSSFVLELGGCPDPPLCQASGAQRSRRL